MYVRYIMLCTQSCTDEVKSGFIDTVLMRPHSLSACSTPAYDYAPNPDKQWILQVEKSYLNFHLIMTAY